MLNPEYKAWLTKQPCIFTDNVSVIHPEYSFELNDKTVFAKYDLNCLPLSVDTDHFYPNQMSLWMNPLWIKGKMVRLFRKFLLEVHSMPIEKVSMDKNKALDNLLVIVKSFYSK